MKSKLRLSTVLVALGALALVALIVRALSAGPAYDTRDKDKEKAKRVAAAPSGQVDERFPLVPGGLVGGNGIVEPAQRETRIAAPTAGVVSAIFVKEGDSVEKDTVLAELERAVEEAAVKAAESDVAASRANLDRTLHGSRIEDRDAAEADAKAAKARAELSKLSADRAEALIKTGAITKEELDRAQKSAAADQASERAVHARYRLAAGGSRREDIAAARAQLAGADGRLEQAKAQLERRSVRAPYAGEILQVKSRVGEYYTPGQSEPIVVLGDTSKLRARMDVDERDISKVRLGASAFVVADGFQGVRFPGRVSEIGRRMGRKNVRTDEPTERLDTKILEIVVELDESKGLVPGLRVTSYVESGGKS